jgi:lipopolysaccharide export system protein LptC
MNLVVHVYNSEGKPETTITMEEAAYDLVVGELASKTPSKIEQPRFTMTGDKMIYQTESQVARMVGNVVVIVPDAEGMAPDFGFPGTATPAKKTP